MPEVGPFELEVLKAWGRCQSLHALPYAGGVLDQPAWLLEAFDEVDGALARVKARREESERLETLRRQLGQ